MSLRLGAIVSVLVALPAGAARGEEGDRFFVAEPSDRDETAIDGSLTSTTFFYKETGDLAPPPPGGAIPSRTASPVGRLFTDVRAQLDARHIKGGTMALHGDVRARYVQDGSNPDTNPIGGIDGTVYPDGTRLPVQSGRLGDDELEIRELYVRRDGEAVDVFVGRKFSLELAAVKFDGIELQKRASRRWTYLGFAGLYPTRGSRHIGDDYPKVSSDPSLVDQTGVAEKRVLPVTGGVGGAYRFDRAYGSIGAVAIAPLARDRTGRAETPRIFATAAGYWRRSERLDLFHYLVADATGAAGAGLTNLTLGLNFQPRQTLRFSAQVTRVDTETLNVQVLDQLEQPTLDDTNPLSIGLRNNLEVQRVAQESARAGLSVALAQRRFEISTHGTLRRRPGIDVVLSDGVGVLSFQPAKAVDVFLGIVDRRSWKDLRLGASVVRTFGVGKANLNRSASTVARLDARKELADGRVELEGDLTYLASADDNRGVLCTPTPQSIEDCYGASSVSSIGLGGTGYYRAGRSWFAIAGATVSRQSQTEQLDANPVKLPAILTAGLFLRLAYRF